MKTVFKTLMFFGILTPLMPKCASKVINKIIYGPARVKYNASFITNGTLASGTLKVIRKLRSGWGGARVISKTGLTQHKKVATLSDADINKKHTFAEIVWQSISRENQTVGAKILGPHKKFEIYWENGDINSRTTLL